MKELPGSVKSYKRTPVFTHETIPQGLLKDHMTSENVWGLLHVEKGELEYTIGDTERHVLKPGVNGVIEPRTLHHVKPLGDVSFYIEFFK